MELFSKTNTAFWRSGLKLAYGEKVKRFKIVPLFLMIILLAGCGTMDNSPQNNILEDKRHMFIGTWEGKHVDRGGKLLRTWIQNRSENGTESVLLC